MASKKVVLGIGLLASFFLLVVSLGLYFNLRHDAHFETMLRPEQVDGMSKEQIKLALSEHLATAPALRAYHIIPFVAFAGVLVGTLVYYVMSEKLEKKDSSLRKNTRLILNFLNPHEKLVVETLLAGSGSVPQYELSRLPSLTKVKTHRILAALEQKGVISKQRFGKINRISLNRDLYEVLKG